MTVPERVVIASLLTDTGEWQIYLYSVSVTRKTRHEGVNAAASNDGVRSEQLCGKDKLALNQLGRESHLALVQHLNLLWE